jgi:hypothetical protein
MEVSAGARGRQSGILFLHGNQRAKLMMKAVRELMHQGVDGHR